MTTETLFEGNHWSCPFCTPGWCTSESADELVAKVDEHLQQEHYITIQEYQDGETPRALDAETGRGGSL